MFKNKEFAKHALPVIILGTCMMYVFSCLATDQLNVLTPYFTSTFGWGDLTVTNPVTIGGFICVVLTVFIGILFMKYGAKLITGIAFIGVSIGLCGIAFAGSSGSAVVYTISLLAIRIFVQALQMGAMLLCADWFVKYRGTVMGIVTTGSPINTATAVSALTFGVGSIGLTNTYLIYAAVALLLGILVFALLKSKPSDYGLYPDGLDTAPATVSEAEEVKLSFKDVFSKLDSWMLVIGFGIMWFVVTAVMSYYVVRMEEVGTSASIYLTWLSIGAIGGIPMSVLIGVIDDKFGSIKANYFLILTYLMVLVALLVMKPDNIGLTIVAAFGIAGITGGMNNMIASTTTYVFGSKNYMAANKWIFALQCLIGTFGTMFMSAVRTAKGSLDLAYIVMIVLIVIATVCIAVIGRKPDFDRGN